MSFLHTVLYSFDVMMVNKYEIIWIFHRENTGRNLFNFIVEEYLAHWARYFYLEETGCWCVGLTRDDQ